MKKTLIIIAASLISVFSFSQNLGPNQHLGKILKEDGTQEEGIIEADLTLPWRLQKEIKFFDKMLLEYGSKIKNKDKKEYGPKDIKGYSIGDKVWESQKYADLSAVGPAALGAMFFLERVENGKIKLFNFYGTPPAIVTGETIDQSNEEYRTPLLLIQKGTDKAKVLAPATDLSKFIGDCPEVNEKYKKGEFGNKAVDEDKNKMGKLLARASDGADMSVFVAVVLAYNEKMK